jgi:hypothetical protein
MPSFFVHCQCEKKTTEERMKKKLETEELNEEQLAELEDAFKKSEKLKDHFNQYCQINKIHARFITLNTDVEQEKVTAQLKAEFAAKVILVNHSRKFDVDAKCSNLSIKYSMLYLSVYQLIKSHIQNDTSIGKALTKARKPKTMRAMEFWEQDPHHEREFSAVHFDLEVVIRMIQATIAEKRTDQ